MSNTIEINDFDGLAKNIILDYWDRFEEPTRLAHEALGISYRDRGGEITKAGQQFLSDLGTIVAFSKLPVSYTDGAMKPIPAGYMELYYAAEHALRWDVALKKAYRALIINSLIKAKLHELYSSYFYSGQYDNRKRLYSLPLSLLKLAGAFLKWIAIIVMTAIGFNALRSGEPGAASSLAAAFTITTSLMLMFPRNITAQKATNVPDFNKAISAYKPFVSMENTLGTGHGMVEKLSLMLSRDIDVPNILIDWCRENR